MKEQVEVEIPMEELTGPRSKFLSSCLPFLLEACGEYLSEQINMKLRDLNLSLRHFYLLNVLEELGQLSQNDIANLLNTNNNTIVQLMDDLEELHLAERRRNPENRRQHLVTLTSDGKRTLKKATAVMSSHYDNLLGTLDHKERSTLQSLLLRLIPA